MSPEQLEQRPLPPIDQIAHTDLRKVSAVGQLTIPAPVLRRWDMTEGGRVYVHDFESAILVDSEEFEPTAETDQLQVLGSYAVSKVGQMTLPAVARNRWGLKRGGRVEFLDLYGPILFLPRGGHRTLVESFLPDRELLTEMLKLTNSASSELM